MHAVAPELVADVCGLSQGLLLAGAGVGFVLWLFGWRGHRFWVVLLTTSSAGIYGLQNAAAFKTPPLVAALLLAVAAGILALALVRLLAFGVGGTLGLIIVHATAPSLEQPLAVFVVSGLVSLLLFRWFLMALTSAGGALLLCYAGLGLLNTYGSMDALAWSEQNGAPLNWLCGLLAIMGFLVQFLVERRQARRHEDEEDDGAGILFSFRRLYRRAG